MTTRSLAKPFSMIRTGAGAHSTPCSSQALQARFFALGHHHEIFSRLHVELLALLVTDHTVFFTAVSAHTLFRGAGKYLFDARQVCRQLLTARMLFGPFER